MQISYQLTNDDFLQRQLYASSKSEQHKKTRFRSRASLSIIYVVLGAVLSLSPDKQGLGITFITLGVIWFVLYPIYSRWRYKKHFQKHVKENAKDAINKTVEVSIDETFIEIKDPTGESKLKGSELTELIEIKTHYFIKLTNGSALIVPKHAVTNQEDFKTKIINFGVEHINELDWEWR